MVVEVPKLWRTAEDNRSYELLALTLKCLIFEPLAPHHDRDGTKAALRINQ